MDRSPLPTLPIDTVLDDLRAALRNGHALIQAPTGSGKSTQIPLVLLNEGWLAGRRILMLEPRRPAARMTAARMAAMLGDAVGDTVGYQVRFERKIGPRTRIEVLTEGILTRRLQSDPGLDGVGALLFDEFHEMNLQSELGFALALDLVQGLRPDLRILAMSATLDADPLSALLGGAPIIRGHGRSFPVEICYAERASGPDPIPSVVSAVHRALSEQRGDVLAFLPGAGEINRCRERLVGLADDGIDITPLHGSLASKEQNRALSPGDGRHRRVVLATDIAETSVTIQGIGAVIDCGLSRKPRFRPGSGLTRLVTESISLASAEQRAGRAGRVGPGICYRLWTKAQEHGRPEHRTPEILQCDLAPLVLELALWGVREPAELKWVHIPPRPAWEQALAVLVRLGALDTAGLLTKRGRAMVELPVHPRLAAMLIGAKPSARAVAADLCALISEQDPLVGRPRQPRTADLGIRLQALGDYRSGHNPANMDRRRLAGIDRVARQLLRLTRSAEQQGAESPGALLALAYPDRVAQARGGTDGRYLLAGGPGALLPPDDPLAVHPYLVIADMDARERDSRISLALPIGKPELLDLVGERIATQRELFWDKQREAVATREVTRLDAITLDSRSIPLDPSDDIAGLLIEQIRKDLEHSLLWTDAFRQLQARVSLMCTQDPEGGWPDLSTQRLSQTLPQWLGPWLEGKTGLAQVRQLDLVTILQSQLDWEQRKRLDCEVPSRLSTPAGNSHRIDYIKNDTPTVAVPLQEMLGERDTPTICGGRIKLLLQLLNPAQRPIQVTQDLAGFWSGSYAEVRKEMRGRYPKHHWPENPANAAPMTRSVKRRG